MSTGVSALRGPAPALRSAVPDERRPVRALRPSGPQLPFAVARGATFLALATFGALHWMAMLDPTASGRAWCAVGTGALVMAGLLGAGRLAGVARWAVVAAVTVVAAALAFLGAGTADELLRPDQWNALAAGIARGIDALPGARVPYRGIDEWTRLVIPLGGTVLVTLAALRRVLAPAHPADFVGGHRRPRHRLPARGADPARDAVRRARRRARLRGRVPARCAAGAARAHVPAARAAAADGGARGRPCSRPGSSWRR